MLQEVLPLLFPSLPIAFPILGANLSYLALNTRSIEKRRVCPKDVFSRLLYLLELDIATELLLVALWNILQG